MEPFLKPLSAQEEKSCLDAYQRGDTKARDILVERNLRLVAHVVKKYQGLPDDLDDLISIGTIGLIKAVMTYDSKKGNRLATPPAVLIMLSSHRCVYGSKPISPEQKRTKMAYSGTGFENIYILCSTSDGYVRYAPMYIHSFRLIAPRKLLEAQLFNQQYQNYEDIPNVQDRLRWCRHHMGLMQKEVAELIGITRGHYIDFEVGYVDHYPKEIVDKLAELYQVPVDDLLDDYNRFLYKGQGKLIREYRESLGLKKKQFARLIKRIRVHSRAGRMTRNECLRILGKIFQRPPHKRYRKKQVFKS